MRHAIIAALDLGTIKTCAVTARLHRGGMEIMGMGVTPTSGLRKGSIINMDEAVESIKKAIALAEASTGVRIKSVAVSISGDHIQGLNSRGASSIKGREVSPGDIERSIESARSVCLPLDREILHAVPCEFVLDGHDGIRNPSGMSGSRLEADVHIISGSVSAVRNILKCCEMAGLDVVDLVFGPLASAKSSLTAIERESGVALVEIGGGATGIALYNGGALRHASALGVGGNHLTNDLAVGLRIPMSDAETLKVSAGSMALTDQLPAEGIQITQSGGQVRTITPDHLKGIMAPRCEEILLMVGEELIKRRGYEHAACGVVLTGGFTMLKGFTAMAESILRLPVRQGLPETFSGPHEITNNPAYSTAIGLLAYYPSSDHIKTVNGEGVNSLLKRMRHWARDIFRNSETINQDHKKEGGIECSKSKR